MRRGNGDGSIFKLSGKRRKPYAVRVTVGFTDEGKQQYKYIGYYANKKEAKQALAEYLVNPYNLLMKGVTFAEVFERWMNDNSNMELKNYKSAFNKCSVLHKRKFADITVHELKEQLPNYSPSTQRFYKGMLNHMYKYGMEHEIVSRNLSEFLKYTKEVEKKEKTIFTQEEIQKLWNNINGHYDADIVLILLYTGMRINELFNITCEDVHVDDNYMVGGLKTKAGKNRIIPIHKDIKPLIEKRLANGHNYLITTSRGNQVNYNNFIKASGNWHKTTSAIGVYHTPHETRHTFVTQMNKLKVDRVALKRIVGHTTNDDITDHYTHTSIQELIDTMNKLDYNCIL